MILQTYGFNNIVNSLRGPLELLLGVGHDLAVQGFLLVAGMSSTVDLTGTHTFAVRQPVVTCAVKRMAVVT